MQVIAPPLPRKAIRSIAAVIAIGVGHLIAPAPLAAQFRPDCPLAAAPYTIDTPLVDLMLDPRARQAFDELGLLDKLPAPLHKTEVPTFAAIVSPRVMAKWLKLPPEKLDELASKLGALTIRPEDSIARCARYDAGGPPPLEPTRRPAILIFDKSTGFRDGPSVEAANDALRRIGERRGWEVMVTSDAAAFTPKVLRRFDVVVWNNVSGDVLTLGQRKAFRDYIEGGGGFAGLHGSGGDPIYLWDWYADELIGARFSGHPSNPQFQTARIVVDDPASPITRGLGSGWTLEEEWYSFARSPRGTGARILLTLDESSYAPGELAMGDHPIAWTRCVGEGRSFYSAIGHRPENYSDPKSVLLMEQGLAWALGSSGEPCGDDGARNS